jgi:hypothetical protein
MSHSEGIGGMKQIGFAYEVELYGRPCMVTFSPPVGLVVTGLTQDEAKDVTSALSRVCKHFAGAAEIGAIQETRDAERAQNGTASTGTVAFPDQLAAGVGASPGDSRPLPAVVAPAAPLPLAARDLVVDDIMRLADKSAIVFKRLLSLGVKDKAQFVAFCQANKAKIPCFAKVSNLDERLAQAAEAFQLE